MSSSQAVKECLLAARSPAEIIGASWTAFEYLSLHAYDLAEQVTDNFAAWASAPAPACEGRDALGRAPSMPHTAGYLRPQGTAEMSEDSAARLASELAVLLEERLRAAAGQATDPGDAQACLRAAEAAAEIRGLFAGA